MQGDHDKDFTAALVTKFYQQFIVKLLHLKNADWQIQKIQNITQAIFAKLDLQRKFSILWVFSVNNFCCSNAGCD